MMLFGFMLAAGILGGAIYMAFDKKSGYYGRLASCAALGLMLLTVIICLFLVLTNTYVPVDDSEIIVGAPEVIKKDISGNIMPLILSVLLIIVFYVVIFIVSMKGQKKPERKKKTKQEEDKPFEF